MGTWSWNLNKPHHLTDDHCPRCHFESPYVIGTDSNFVRTILYRPGIGFQGDGLQGYRCSNGNCRKIIQRDIIKFEIISIIISIIHALFFWKSIYGRIFGGFILILISGLIGGIANRIIWANERAKDDFDLNHLLRKIYNF